MSEMKNVEQKASGALEWDERIKGWYATDKDVHRSALQHGWHIGSVFDCLDHGKTVATAYSVADAQRWVLEGVLP
jgi:hypothetical protein